MINICIPDPVFHIRHVPIWENRQEPVEEPNPSDIFIKCIIIIMAAFFVGFLV